MNENPTSLNVEVDEMGQMRAMYDIEGVDRDIFSKDTL